MVASRYLRVTFRRVRGEQADGERVLSVFCPRRGKPIDLRDCNACEYCSGLCVDTTDRDTFLRCRFASGAGMTAREDEMSEADARETPLSAIMSAPARCVPADLSVEALVGIFVETGISAAPVVDEHGVAIGLVSKSDVLRCYHANLQRKLAVQLAGPNTISITADGAEVDEAGAGRMETVNDLMTHVVFSLGEEAPVSRAAALMAYEGIHRIVVTAHNGAAIGIVSSLDILRWVARKDGYVVPGRPHAENERAEEELGS